MAVTNATPKVQFTGNNSTTEFAFNFVVPASLDTGLINDSTAGITQGTTSLTVSTADLFYTSDLQGKTITIAGAGAGSSTLTTTIVTVNSATNVTIADAASVTVSSATIVVTTGQTGTTLKNNNEIEVFVDSTKKTITTDYTVRLNVGDDINKQGTVIFTSPPATSTTVTIARNIELSRTSDFQAGGALTAKELNAQFDNVVMAVQDQKNDDDRFIQFPPDEPSSTSGVLPDANTRAGKFFAFDTNGDITLGNTVNLPNASLIVSSVAADSGDITQFNATNGTITNLTSNNVDISGGLIDSTSIGSNTPSTGAFTTLTASGQATFPAVNINGGTIDGATIGADSPADGTFANLTVNGTLTNTGGSFVLGSVIATGSDGIRTKKVRSETTNELSIESQSNQDISITTDGSGKLNLKSSDIQINPTGTTSTTAGGRTYTGNIITSDNDLIFNNYNSPGSGAIKFISNDGIHIDGTNPKVKGQLQLQLEDGSASNNILISNSADFDTAGIQLNNHASSGIQIGQLTFPPDFLEQTGSIDQAKFLKTYYKKSIVLGRSGQSFQYPSAAVGDKVIKVGDNTKFGYVTKAVTGASTSSSITYEVITQTQTWGGGSTVIIQDSAGQQNGFTPDPTISTENNDTGFYVGFADITEGGIDSDTFTEGSTNLYYTDARVLTKINATSIDALSDVDTTTSAPTDGQVLTFEASSSQFKPATPLTAPVLSVNSKTGTVTLDTNDISEGTHNLYFTNTRFDTRFDSQFLNKTTDNLAEGSTNLYHTDERVDDRVSNLLTAGTGISLSYNDSSNSLTITNTQSLNEIINDTSPQLGNGLDVNGHEIFSLSNQDIKIQPHGTGALAVGADNTDATITTNGTGDLTLSTNGGTNSGTIKIIDGVDGEIELTPNGSGNINLHGYRWPSGTSTAFANGFLKISSVVGGVAQLAWSSGSASGLNNLVDDTSPQLGGSLDVNGQIITSTSNGDIKIQPNGSGTVEANKSLEVYGGATDTRGIFLNNFNGASPTGSQLFNVGLQIETEGGSSFASQGGNFPSIVMTANDSNGAYPNLWLQRSRSDDRTNPAFLQNNDIIFSFFGAAYDNNALGYGANYYNKTCAVDFKASEDHSAGNMGGKIEIRTEGNGHNATATGDLRLTIDDNIELNTPLDVNGQNITSSSNGDINILPNGSGKTNLKRVVINDADGLMVRGPGYEDISLHRREATSHATYSLEVQHDHGSDGFSAGDPAGAFGMAAYADSTNNTGNSSYIYVGQINGVIGDGDSLSSATGADINNGVRAYVYQNGISGSGGGFDVLNAATFRSTNADFMQEKLKFNYASNTVSIDSADSSGAIAFKTNGTERIRINNGGDLIINTTAAINSAQVTNKFNRVSHIGMVSENDGGNFSTEHIRFKNTGTTRGSIVVDQSSTTYNTSSDYRLKENVVYDWDATTRLKQLKPARFNFIEDETDTAIDGFIAHEVTSVVPNAVYGEKDAVEDDGAIKPQQIDQSKLVPLLVKTIQELEQRITDLENGN